MQDFRQLQVWQKSHALTLAIYAATGGFPRDELYGLTSQMRRSAGSIPTNLAEGCGRGGVTELARFAQIARGSASELEYQLLLACDLKLLTTADYDEFSDRLAEIQKMLASFHQAVIQRGA
ncbi:MAG: four helix bundle protein [Chloroflexota bacterium]